MPNRKVVVAGGTGFIGKRLVSSLVTTGDDVVVLSRDPKPLLDGLEDRNVRQVVWDAANLGEWSSELDGAYAVVNLTGESVAQRWTEGARQRIRHSRVDSINVLCSAIHRAANPPKRWINASAVGYFGDRPGEVVDEDSLAGSGFLSETCVELEEVLFKCALTSTGRAVVRIGVVLGTEGALLPLAKLARMGLGGAAGSGSQGVSWIHLDDLVRTFVWLLDVTDFPEVVDGVSPNPVSNRDFMAALRRAVGMPIGLPAPAFALRMIAPILGVDSGLVLEGSFVRPGVLADRGFAYKFAHLDAALSDILGR